MEFKLDAQPGVTRGSNSEIPSPSGLVRPLRPSRQFNNTPNIEDLEVKFNRQRGWGRDPYSFEDGKYRRPSNK